VAAGHLDHEVPQAPWMVSEADDDRRAAGRALLMQFVDAGDADIGSGGGVDAGSRGPHQRQPHRVAPQQYQAHFGLVYLDLEPEHLTQERGSGRKIVNLQVGPAAQELSHRNMLRLHWSPPHARSAVLQVDSRPVPGWPAVPEQVDLWRQCRREGHGEPASLPGLVPVVADVGHERADQLVVVRSCGQRWRLRFAGPPPDADDLRDRRPRG